MGCNVFLIASPLQALNALEACQELGIAPKNAVMICCDSAAEINDRQTRKILAEETWREFHTVQYFGPTLKAWFGRMVRLNAITRSLPDCEHLFLGDYGFDLARHLNHRLQPRKTVLLDDGSATISISSTRRDPSLPKYFLKPPFTSTGKLYLKRFLGMRDKPVKRVTYFSVYTFDPEQGSELVANDYRRLRGRATMQVDADSLYFLGTSVGEQYGITDDEYIDIVSRAIGRLGRFSTRYYLPHRHESTKRLDRLATELPISLRRFDAPIEYALCCQCAQIPGTIAGFASSAFDNIHRLFGDRVRLRVFEMPGVSGEDELYKEYYSYYRREYRAPQFEIVSVF